ncbi:MAG: alpha/beta hydrolase [Caldilineaceae bacterium]|nr:alpha/beta hydrolase [Caldilineaceae bacterium]
MARWSASSVNVNGLYIHYYRTGGAKPPLVFAHGLTDNGLCWAPLVRHLEADYDCIMVDARGHGWSAAPTQGYTNADHAADYAGLIQQLKLDQPALIGHSMGGGTGAQLAASYPDLLRGLVLEDPPWRAQAPAPLTEERRVQAEQWRGETRANRERSLEQLLANARQRNLTWSDAEFDQWAPAKHQVEPQALDYAIYPSIPWQEVVPAIQCPTLLITADHSAGAIVEPSTAQQVAALNPRVEVVTLAGAGHNIRREQFDAFVAVVQPFLARLS